MCKILKEFNSGEAQDVGVTLGTVLEGSPPEGKQEGSLCNTSGVKQAWNCLHVKTGESEDHVIDANEYLVFEDEVKLTYIGVA